MLEEQESRNCGESTAVIPEVLQSDNGGEFLEECVRMVRKHFGTIKIVKGKARKPSMQDSVERGNAPLKRSLFKWIEKNSGVGAYIINACPSRSKDNKTSYEIYYGKHSVGQAEYYMDPELLKAARTEYSMMN